MIRPAPDPAQVRQVQHILKLPETGILCRATIIAAAKHTRSWHRGPSLIPLVLAAQTTSSLPPEEAAADTSSE